MTSDSPKIPPARIGDLCSASNLTDFSWNNNFSRILEDILKLISNFRCNEETQTDVTVNSQLENDVNNLSEMYTDRELKDIEFMFFLRRSSNSLT